MINFFEMLAAHFAANTLGVPFANPLVQLAPLLDKDWMASFLILLAPILVRPFPIKSILALRQWCAVELHQGDFPSMTIYGRTCFLTTLPLTI
jgi:hypothetical protein